MIIIKNNLLALTLVWLGGRTLSDLIALAVREVTSLTGGNTSPLSARPPSRILDSRSGPDTLLETLGEDLRVHALL